MTADHRPLLDIQRLDTEAEQLRHRRASLPERRKVAEVEAELAAVDRRGAALAAEREAHTKRQRQAEVELAAVEAKSTELETQLYGGSVSSTREMQALQHELDTLRAQRSDLEDEILSLLDGADSETTEEAALREERDRVTARLDEANQVLAEAEGVVDAELARVAAARARAADALPADAVSAYEARRPGLDGVGVVGFGSGGCVGCPSRMPAVEVARVKLLAEGELTECDECGRLVVR